MEMLVKIAGVRDEANPLRGLPPELIVEIFDLASKSGGNIYYPAVEAAPNLVSRGGLPPTEIIVALGSAGVFSAMFQVISSYLVKNKDREITLEHKGSKITIKGHDLPEEKELLRKLLVEIDEPPTRKRKSRK